MVWPGLGASRRSVAGMMRDFWKSLPSATCSSHQGAMRFQMSQVCWTVGLLGGISGLYPAALCRKKGLRQMSGDILPAFALGSWRSREDSIAVAGERIVQSGGLEAILDL